jgi:hypothetical protein
MNYPWITSIAKAIYTQLNEQATSKQQDFQDFSQSAADGHPFISILDL